MCGQSGTWRYAGVTRLRGRSLRQRQRNSRYSGSPSVPTGVWPPTTAGRRLVSPLMPGRLLRSIERGVHLDGADDRRGLEMRDPVEPRDLAGQEFEERGVVAAGQRGHEVGAASGG